MRITATELAGVWILDQERRADERGSFARTFCVRELAQQGLDAHIEQMSASVNARRGTLRGLHFQRDPHAETKLVRVTRGAVYDVVVDLRPESGSYLHWFGLELSAANGRTLYVPKGFAHGFETLVDDVEVLYAMDRPYVAESASGVRWDDPAFAIRWPMVPVEMSDADRTRPSLST